MHGEIVVEFTKHARSKCAERGIHLKDIEETILRPDRKMKDTIDPSLDHYIRPIDSEYLRVIGRWESDAAFLVVTAFFDRRLKEKG